MKKIKFIVLIGMMLVLMTACNKPVSKTEVYSVSGENAEISINNGLIIITDESEKFIGGDLSFKDEEMTDVKEYAQTFFYDKDGEETAILTNKSSIEGTSEGEGINLETGTISSGDLFTEDDLESVKNSLSFSLSGKLMNGEDFDYRLTLDVEKAY